MWKLSIAPRSLFHLTVYLFTSLITLCSSPPLTLPFCLGCFVGHCELKSLFYPVLLLLVLISTEWLKLWLRKHSHFQACWHPWLKSCYWNIFDGCRIVFWYNDSEEDCSKWSAGCAGCCLLIAFLVAAGVLRIGLIGHSFQIGAEGQFRGSAFTLA